MAKPPTSVIGLDLGRHAFKAVVLHRQGSELVLNDFAIHEHSTPIQSEAALTQQLTVLFSKLKTTNLPVAVTCSIGAPLIQIRPAKESAREKVLRSMMEDGGSTLNLKDYVLDCVQLVTPKHDKLYKHLVVGLNQSTVGQVEQALLRLKAKVLSLEVPAVSVVNAFEVARPADFSRAFVLLDLAPTSAVLLAGVNGQVVSVRTLEVGARAVMAAVAPFDPSGEVSPQGFDKLLSNSTPAANAASRVLAPLGQAIKNGVAGLENEYGVSVANVFVSGLLTSSNAMLKLLGGDSAAQTCVSWGPTRGFTLSLNSTEQAELNQWVFGLHAALGAAATALKGGVA